MGTSHMKEHLNLSILATSDTQFLYPTGSSGSKFEPILAEFIYFAANRDNAVNHILITGIVLNSILTAFDFVNVPNSDIAIF